MILGPKTPASPLAERPSGEEGLGSLRASVMATGTELVLGSLLDTNSPYLARELSLLGIRTCRHLSLGDSLESLVPAFRESLALYPLTLVTGGLGPTEDDLTRLAASLAFGLPLEFRGDLAENLADFMERRGFPLSPNNYRQAFLPKGARLIPNPRGTAPAFAILGDKRLIIFLPGVPAEMRYLFRDEVVPLVREFFPPSSLGHLETFALKVGGLGESRVDAAIGDLARERANPSIGLLAGLNETKILITVKAGSPAEAREMAGPSIAEIKKRLRGNVFGEGQDSIHSALARLIQDRGLKLGLLDGLSGGRLGLSLSPFLREADFSGSLAYPWPEPEGDNSQEDGPAERYRAERGQTEKSPTGGLGQKESAPGQGKGPYRGSPYEGAPYLDPEGASFLKSRGSHLIVSLLAERPIRPGQDPGDFALHGRMVIALGEKGPITLPPFPLSGKQSQIMDRAAALAAFGLWQSLAFGLKP